MYLQSHVSLDNSPSGIAAPHPQHPTKLPHDNYQTKPSNTLGVSVSQKNPLKQDHKPHSYISKPQIKACG